MVIRSVGEPGSAARVAALVLALGASVAPLAGAAPQIRVTSPSPGAAIYNMLPGISVEYSSDDPQKPLNLESLSVTVELQGRQWPGSVSAGPTSATFTLGAPLVAGDLTIAASIADVSGATATTSQSYSVFPTFQAISPNKGYVGDTILLSVVGLDPSGSNVATFSSLYDYTAGVSAPIALGDTTATVVVPETAMSGPVSVSVNGKRSRETFRFTVTPPYPDCGRVDKMIGLPDGSLLIKHYYYSGSSVCPAVSNTYPYGGPQPVVTLASKDRHLLVQDSHILVTYPYGWDTVTDIAVDKAAKRVAVLTTALTASGESDLRVYLYDLEQLRKGIRTPVVTKVFWGRQYGQMADFDAQGNLYVATADLGLPNRQGLKLNRFAKASIEAGGAASYDTVMQFPLDYGNDFRISCKGTGYVAGYFAWDTYDDTKPVFVVDLKDPQSPVTVGQFLAPGPYSVTGLSATCHSDEVWGDSLVLLDDGTYAMGVWRWDSQVGGAPEFKDKMPWVYSGMAVAPSGRFLLYGDGSGVVPSRASVVPCADAATADDPSICSTAPTLAPTLASPLASPSCGGLAQAFCGLVTPPKIEILPSTTRWKPQKDVSSPSGDILIKFSSSVPLQSATVTIKGPSTVAPITQSFSVDNPPNPYVITWPGTSRLTNPNDPTSYLNAGDYTLSITGTRAQGEPISTAADDPNAKVSLVKIEAIELTDFRGSQVTANPGPDATFAGVGQRVFAEAQDPLVDSAAPPPVYDTIRVAARVVPPVPLVEGQPTITVSFQAIDADDPYVGGRIDDEGNRVDNRGDAGAGFIPLAAFASNDALPAPVPVGSVFGVDAPRQPPAGGDSMTVDVAFRVSHRHGDNYRVLASLDANSLGQRVTAQQRTPRTVNNVRYPAGWVERDGTPLPVNLERVEVSELLTVWRTLHLEVDHLASQDPAADQRRLDVQGDFTALERSKLRDGEPTDPDPTPFVDENGQADVQRLDNWVLHDGLNPWLGADLTVGFHSGDVYEVTGNGDKHVDVRIGNNQPPLDNNLSAAELAQLADKSYVLRDDPLDSLQKQADYGFAEVILRRFYVAVVPMTQAPSETEVPFVISQYSQYSQTQGDPAKRLDTRNIVGDANYGLEAQGSSSPDYWSVQLVSAFDGNPESDFDPTEEWDWRVRRETSSGNLGLTTIGSCTVQTATGPVRRGGCKAHASVFMETLRDFVRRTPRGFDPPGETVLNRRATAHELLHAFRVQHGSALMCASVMMRRGDRGECITERQAQTIRDIVQPQLSESRDRQCTQDGNDSCWRLQP